jgi:hypothetical protein
MKATTIAARFAVNTLARVENDLDVALILPALPDEVRDQFAALRSRVHFLLEPLAEDLQRMLREEHDR